MPHDDGSFRSGRGTNGHAGGDRPEHATVSEPHAAAGKDYFCERDGERFAGVHLFVDLIRAEHLDNVPHIERALEACTEAAGATLLHLHLHRFTPAGGVSGVAVLAESHISIHTWPEHGYAAVDLFMCGDTDPLAAVAVLREMFTPARLAVQEHLRGKESDLWTPGSTRPSMAASASA